MARISEELPVPSQTCQLPTFGSQLLLCVFSLLEVRRWAPETRGWTLALSCHSTDQSYNPSSSLPNPSPSTSVALLSEKQQLKLEEGLFKGWLDPPHCLFSYDAPITTLLLHKDIPNSNLVEIYILGKKHTQTSFLCISVFCHSIPVYILGSLEEMLPF